MAEKIIFYDGKDQEQLELDIIEAFRNSESKSKTLVTFFEHCIFKMVEDTDYFFACEITDAEIEAFSYVLNDNRKMHVPRTSE